MMIKIKKIILFPLLAAALVTHAVCLAPESFFDFYSVFSPEREKVILMPSSLRVELTPGESETVELISRPRGLDVAWHSSDARVCEISAAGNDGCTLKAVSPGECTVTVAHPASGAKTDIKVNVAQRAAQISLDRQNITLARGESTVIHAHIDPPGADAGIDWRVTPQGAAAMSFGGGVCRIKALTAGEFDVSATLRDGRSATAHVTVEGSRDLGGYRLCIALLIIGAVLLIAYAWRAYSRTASPWLSIL